MRTMCLLLLSYDSHPDYRFILAANRDEYYSRPTRPLDFWKDSPNTLAGKDLKSHGTWLGISRTGRIAAITNYREPESLKINPPSRGMLVSNYLNENSTPQTYLEHIKTLSHRLNGFNLVVGDMSDLFYYSNRGKGIQKLTPGYYGLCNHLLDTPWPKVEKGKADLKTLLSAEMEINSEEIFKILADNSCPPDDTLPDTGFDRDWERILSSIFITSDGYGTRSSSIILMERTGKITFWERTFAHGTIPSGEHHTRKISLMISASEL